MRDGWVKFKVSDSQNFWQGKGMGYQFYSEIYGLQEQVNVLYKFFKNAKAKEWTTFAPLSQAEYVASVQRWRHWLILGLDVQELTESIENKNAKSLNYWLGKFVQKVANKSGGRYPSRTLYIIVCV